MKKKFFDQKIFFDQKKFSKLLLIEIPKTTSQLKSQKLDRSLERESREQEQQNSKNTDLQNHVKVSSTSNATVSGNNYVILKPKFLSKDSTFDKILNSYDAVDVSSKNGQEIIKNLSSSAEPLSSDVSRQNTNLQSATKNFKNDVNGGPNTKIRSNNQSKTNQNNHKNPYQRINNPKTSHIHHTNFLSECQKTKSSLKSVEILTTAKVHKPIVDTNLKRPKKKTTIKNYQLVEIYNENPLGNSLEEVERFEGVGEKIVRIARD